MKGSENPLCTPAVPVPAGGRVLINCPTSARYITVQAPGSAALDVCALAAFLQSALSSRWLVDLLDWLTD